MTKKNKMKKNKLFIVAIIAATILAIFLISILQISRGNTLLVKGKFPEAKAAYPSVFGLCKHERALADLLAQNEDTEAVKYADEHINDTEIVKFTKENCYNKMLAAIDGHDYITAQEYMQAIPGYRDIDSRKKDVDQEALYQQATEKLSESIHEAILLLEELPEDYKDVSVLLDMFLPYDKYIGKEYGDYWGYITDYLKIEGLKYDSEKNSVIFPEWGNAEVERSSLEDYDFEATWENYDRTAYWNENQALVVSEGGVTNILYPDGKVEHLGAVHKAPDSNKKTCPACGGVGYVKYYYGASDSEAYLDGFEPYTFGECTMCHGTGTVTD